MSQNTHNTPHALFKKETHVLAWLASLVIIMLLANAFTVQRRYNAVVEKDAAATPKASQNVGVLSFNWEQLTEAQASGYALGKEKRMVVVNVQLLNLQSRAVRFTPSLESYVTDAKSNKYPPADIRLVNSFEPGVYEPQYAAQGRIAYALPDDLSDPKWCYALAPVNGGGEPVCVALNKYSQQ